MGSDRMNDKYNARRVAKQYFVDTMTDTLYHAKRTLRLARSEYYDRITNIGHMNEQQQMDTKRRVADAIEKQLDVIIEINPEFFDGVDQNDGSINTKELVKFGMNTKYLYVECWEDGELKTELNKDAQLLVGLIYEMITGRGY